MKQKNQINTNFTIFEFQKNLMKKFILLISLFLGHFILFSQTRRNGGADKIVFKKISDEILSNSNAYHNLYELTKGVGVRFSTSPNYAKAVKWATKKLQNAGAEKVWTQDVVVPNWKRGKESLSIKTENGRWTSINMLSLGGSEGTNGKDLVGEILFVENIDEFKKLFSKDVKGKIIFFNYPFDQTIINPVEAYLIAGKYRWKTPSLVAEKGAIAVITRSATSAFDDVPHTGSMYYKKEAKKKIPAMTIGAKSADRLEKLVKKQKVFAKINSTSTTDGVRIAQNVIGEIKGKKDNKIIVIGAHLDTWDISEGAHDDGAGVVQCMEVLRALKKLNINNRHTIRVVLYANEENGVNGGKAYASNAKKKEEKHIFALESDAGGYAPRGISLDMIPQYRRKIFAWKSLFLPYGVYNFDEEYAGQDILPLKKQGVPLAELVPDMQRYFDIHHTKNDTFDKINRRELLLGAITMAQLIYMIDKYW